jgi:hypothetical protein
MAPKMPYSEDFIPMNRFCIVPNGQGSVLKAFVWIRWLHKPMLVKSILKLLTSAKIDQVTTDGLVETVNEFIRSIDSVLFEE